jgi:hypothetical protein
MPLCVFKGVNEMIPDVGLLATWLALLSAVGAVLMALYGYWSNNPGLTAPGRAIVVGR